MDDRKKRESREEEPAAERVGGDGVAGEATPPDEGDADTGPDTEAEPADEPEDA